MYTPGDKVKVISYQHSCPRMGKFVGKICTIDKEDSKNWFSLQETQAYVWRTEWLEPYEEKKIKIYVKDIKDMFK